MELSTFTEAASSEHLSFGQTHEAKNLAYCWVWSVIFFHMIQYVYFIIPLGHPICPHRSQLYPMLWGIADTHSTLIALLWWVKLRERYFREDIQISRAPEIQETSSLCHVLFYELTYLLIVRFQIRLQC